jgi:RNA polymerase sigma factor (TIGR02999 family)
MAINGCLYMCGSDHDITLLVRAAHGGDRRAADTLFSRIYAELRERASWRARRMPLDTLNTTGLVNESYLKLFAHTPIEVRDREHFFALASSAMRMISIDRARQRMAAKRNRGQVPLCGTIDAPQSNLRAEQLLLVEQLLGRLAEIDARLARVVEWHFFGGVEFKEMAQLWGITERTVQRDWARARALLARWLEDGTR